MAIEAAAIAAADPERFGVRPFHQLAVSVNHARHPFAFIPRHRGQREGGGDGRRRKRVERKRGQKNGQRDERAKGAALGARKKAIEGSSRGEREITNRQGDLSMEFS